jgi:hypothetical protein
LNWRAALPWILVTLAACSIIAALILGASTKSLVLFVLVFVGLGAVEAGLAEVIRRRFQDSVLLQGIVFLVFTALFLAIAFTYL